MLAAANPPFKTPGDLTQLPTLHLGLIQYRAGGPKSRLPYARDWRELGIKEAAKPVGRCRASNVLIATSFSGPVALIMSGAARCPTRMSVDNCPRRRLCAHG